MSLDLAKFGHFLKNHYIEYPKAKWMYNRTSPLLSKIKKIRTGGKQSVQPILYGLPQARSRDFSKADAKAKKGDFVTVESTFKMDKDYAIFRVDGQAIAASEMQPLSFARALVTQSDLQLQTLVNNRSTALYGSGNGVRGQIKAIQSGRTTFTVKDKSFHMNLAVGMELVFSSVASGGAARAGGAATITKIDRKDLKLTVSAALNAAVAADDYIFANGDYIASGATDIIMDGLESFAPDTIGGSDSFRGMNRSKDRERLAGTVHTQVSNTTLEETVLDACAALGNNTGMIDCLYMNPLTFNDFVQELGSRVRYNRDEIRKTPMGKIGFKYLEIDTAGAIGGTAKVYSDPYCPEKLIWGLNMNMPELYYLGEDFIFLDKIDGNRHLRDLDGDEVQGRHKSYANLHLPKPVDMLKIKLN